MLKPRGAYSNAALSLSPMYPAASAGIEFQRLLPSDVPPPAKSTLVLIADIASRTADEFRRIPSS